MMTTHIGIYPCGTVGYLSYYKEAEKRTGGSEINGVQPHDSAKVNSMLKEFISKINGKVGKIGHVCIYLNKNYGNEIRKKFVEEGLKIGFKNVEIINLLTILYLNAMSKVNYKPLNGNVIWIKYSSIYLQHNIYMWQINGTKAEFIGEFKADVSKLSDLENVVNDSKLNKGPDAVLSANNIDRAYINKISPACQFFTFNVAVSRYSKECLLKARINAGDRDLAHLNVINFLSYKITLIYDGKRITYFNVGQHLPVNYSRKIFKNSDIDMLIILVNEREGETFMIPNHGENYFTLRIDTNGIYYISFDDQKCENERYDEKNIDATYVSSSKLYNISTIPTSLNTKINAVGIDLGTSRCCAAVIRKNGINTVPLDNTGERLLPSYVSYDEKNVKCGKIVVQRLRNSSKSTIFDSKRIIGRNINETEIDLFWPFGISDRNGKVFMEIQKFKGIDKKFVRGFVSAEEVAAELLKHVKQKTEEFQGKKLTKAVVTVPAAFSEAQKNATMEAAKLAGWNEIVLLPEPIAAAFAYFNDRPIPNNSNVLLFDLGGGTLDVCIFRIQNNQINVISNTGDSKFGGRDFDTVLINYFKNTLNTKYGISLVKNKKYLLLSKCQEIKESLSDMSLTKVDLDVDVFDPNQDDVIAIVREDFEKMSEPLLNKVKNTIQSSLFCCNFKADQINKVLLVGGGSRMPMIKQLLREIFTKAEHCCEEHPDEVVAVGAAYYAYSIFSE